VLEVFGGACAFCGSTIEVVKDHLVPLCRGGTDWHENLVPACKTCNGTKGGRDPNEAIRRLATPDRTERLVARLEASWNLPGNRTRRAYEKVTTERLLAEAQRILDAFGTVTARLLDEHTRYASSSYARRFNGMNGLRVLLGLPTYIGRSSGQ
jgi:hypothetical protein